MQLQCNLQDQQKVPIWRQLQKENSRLQSNLQDLRHDIYRKYPAESEKERMNQHAQDIRVLVNTGKTSDSFAKHFAKHFGPAEKATVAKARELVKVEVEWQGNPISIMRSFGKLNCGLCMKERIKILHLSRNDPGKLINSNSEKRKPTTRYTPRQ